jgi:aminoglycoside phosphotransferase (APT) family kinase protein
LVGSARGREDLRPRLIGTTTTLLSEETAADYLRARGLLQDWERVTVRALGGGVSNVVLEVLSPQRQLVVKQALPRLRVTEEWLAKKERSVTEGRALRALARLSPGSVPAVYDVDEERCALTIEAAPAGWRVWKEELLAGRADAGRAGELGRLVGLMHASTHAEEWRSFDDDEAFNQLRVHPYYDTIAARHPDLTAVVGAAAQEMRERKSCLVHGDCSPKNVLLGPDRLWLIDFEVAHFGDPVFDVAFLLNHLLLKAIARPGVRGGYAECAVAFLEAYAAAGGAGADDEEYLGLHLGCLLLARVDGKSPVEYLDEDGRRRARALGRLLLSARPAERRSPWELLARR